MQHDAQLVPIATLKPYKGNARTHNLDVIRDSLRVHGQYRPVVVRAKTREVLAGNGTMAAAIEEGWDEMWATFVDVDARAAKRIVLVDNRANDLAGYDDGALAKLLEGLPTLDGTGFDDGDLASLLAGLDDGDPGRDTEPAEPPADPKTRLGDLWVLGEHRLLCGDATSAGDVERLVNGESIGLILTDPPYGVSVVKSEMVGADFGVARKGRYRPMVGDTDTTAGIAAYALLKPMCNRIVFWGGNHFADRLPASNCWLVWDKRSDSGIENTFADVIIDRWERHTGLTAQKAGRNRKAA